MKWILLLFYTFAFSSFAQLRTDENVIEVCKKGSTEECRINFKNGSNQAIISNPVSGKLEFTNDGVNYKKFGSGSGGSGGGDGYNNAFTDDQNANAEEGTAGWVASDGPFSSSLGDPLEGGQSFIWTPQSQDDTLTSPALNFDRSIFRGRSCQAQIEYIGGDENLTLRIINADNEVLGSQVLQVHTISAVESVFFACPSEADITADADKGELRLQLINAGATGSAQIKFDKAYAGTLIGLSESVLPDRMVGTVGTDGLVESDFEWLTCSGTTTKTCTYTHTYTSVPKCFAETVNTYSSLPTIIVENETTTGFNVQTKATNTASPTNAPFKIVCFKQGADAKQSVQVWKNIPKVAENENDFKAFFSESGELISTSIDGWVSNATITSTSNYSHSFTGGLFKFPPICDVDPVIDSNYGASAASTLEIQNGPSTTTSFYFISKSTGSSANGNDTPASGYVMECTRDSRDRRSPTVQPVIVGQVTNSYAESISKNTRVESCRINNNGSVSLDSDMCSSWIESVTRSGLGRVSAAIKTGIFSSNPDCSITPLKSVAGVSSAGHANWHTTVSNVLLDWRTSLNNDSGYDDEDVMIICFGKR